MKRLINLIIIVCFPAFVFGAKCPEIDTAFIAKQAKRMIIKTNKNLYEDSSKLDIDWNAYQLICGKSIDCSKNDFVFILVSFTNSNGNYANAIFEYKSKKKFVLLECHFTIDPVHNILNDIKLDPENFWNCNI
jgi:hypothetical protein